MSTVTNLVTSISEVIRDPGLAEITQAQIITFLNDAAQDASGQGWLIWLADNTSLSFGVGDFDYSVPTSFAYIKDLESPTSVIARHYWDLRLVSSTPTILFNSFFTIPTGTLKVTGYRRPTTTYTSGSDTIDVGMESFLRERAASLALEMMSAGLSELDRLRSTQAERRFRNSEMALERRVKFIERLVPTLRLVPGR
jgi:hypothetical protein